MCKVGFHRLKGVLASGALFICIVSSVAVQGQEFTSIQLVGRFGGITCEPDDPANEMSPAGAHLWSKLKLINEPGDPDTIFFKFTADGSYMPKHWGWSFIHGWGIAEYDWSPPSIAAILPECGYYEFFFNDTTYEYWLDRPDARIEGELLSNVPGGVPTDAAITLMSSIDGCVGTCSSFSGTSFTFDYLPEGEFSVTASAPGYRDTKVTGLFTSSGMTEYVTLELVPVTAVQVLSASCERTAGGVLLTWIAYCCGEQVGFDVYRSDAPVFESAVRRTPEPVYGVTSFSWFDECDQPQVDRYYWLLEIDSADPALIGPILAAGLPGLPSSVGQNYPNPFNPATTIPYVIGSASGPSAVSVAFFDTAGRLISRRDLGVQPAGEHTFVWNPALSTGSAIPSGVYYCRVQIGRETFTRKLILLR